MTSLIVLPVLAMIYLYSPVPGEVDALGLTEELGLSEALLEELGLELLLAEELGLSEALLELDGETEELGLSERDTLADGEAEALALELGETEELGLCERDTEADGLTELDGLTLELGLTDSEAEAEELGLCDCEADLEALALGLSDADALLAAEAIVKVAPSESGRQMATNSIFPPVTAAVAIVSRISLVIIFSVETLDSSRVASGVASCHISSANRAVPVV